MSRSLKKFYEFPRYILETKSPTFHIHRCIFLLLQVDIRLIDPNDGLVEEPERLLNMFGLHLILAVHAGDPLGETDHGLELSDCDPPRRLGRAAPVTLT